MLVKQPMSYNPQSTLKAHQNNSVLKLPVEYQDQRSLVGVKVEGVPHEGGHHQDGSASGAHQSGFLN